MQIRKCSGKLAGALSAAVVFAGALCASGDIAVGPGKFSSFETSNGKAVVVGVSGLSWDDFNSEDCYWATCFVGDNVVDAEKTAEDDNDDYWCGPITDMNLLYITGWAKKTKYSTVDDMVDYFRANPTLLRYATVPGDIGSVREGKYGYEYGKDIYDGIFRWFKDTTKVDLSSSKKTSTAKLDAKTFKTLMSNGEYVMNISVGFSVGNGNPKWNDYNVSHAVVCCGYETDSSGDLTGLFIIDSDNDQYYNDEGGIYAPNSIAYCPVENYDGYYSVYGIWGTYSQLLNGYTALKMNVERVTLTLNANGGKVSPASITVVEGNTYGEFPEPTKNNGEFDGWWTDKSGGVQVFEGDVIDFSIFPNPKKPTLYAQWREVHKITVSGGILSNDSTSMSGLYRGDSVDVAIDGDKLFDRNGNEVNAFSYWSYTPATADLGYEFDPYSPSTYVTMPNADVKLTANYVNNFDGRVYPFYNTIGEEDPGEFYWSVDNGKTLIPFTGSVLDNGYPVKSGTLTIKFYDKTGNWRASDTTITVGKRGTSKSDGVTYYDDPGYYDFYATFVPVASSMAVKFDGNGGKASTASAWFVDGYEYGYNLPSAERKGYVFAGWWTAKTGGERISSEATFTASMFAGQKTPTLYAHWLSLVKLTLKDSTANVSWYLEGFSDEIMDSIANSYPELLDGGYQEGAGTIQVLSGARVNVSVADGIEGKNDSWLMFQKWTVTPSKAEMGSTFRVTSPSTEFTMPADAVTLQATYIDETTCGWVYPNVYASSINLGDDSYLEPPYSAFEWSPDSGKTWYKIEEAAMLKKGSYTVTWRSSDPCWQAPTTKTKVNVTEGGEAYVEGSFTFIPQVVVDVMTFENDECVLSPAGGSVTMNPKDGLVPAKKSITLTAKASDAKKYVFQGYSFKKMVWEYYDSDGYYEGSEVGEWNYESGFYTTAATWKLENSVEGGLCSEPDPLFYQYIDSTDHKVHIVAVFKALSDYDEEDIMFSGLYGENGAYNSVSDDGYGNVSVDVRAVVGCSLPQGYSLYFNGAKSFPLTFKLSGKLPAGLKFDAKTGVFSGAPTKDGTASVTITATDPAKNSKDLTVNFTVNPLPDWVAGDFRAVGSNCLLEMSVTSAGKVSAKLLTCLGTRSISGTLSWTQDMDDPEGDGTFGFNPPDTKNGEECSISFNPDGTIYGIATSYLKSNGLAGGDVEGRCLDKAMLQNATAILDKYYTVRLDSSLSDEPEDSYSSTVGHGYLTIKTDKKGSAKVTGQLADGEKVSVSGLLLPVDEGYAAMLYLFASPSSYKKEGCFVMSLYLSDGSVSSMNEGSWTLGSGARYSVTGYGTEYSASSSLEEYYWTISCASSEGVQQEYSWKETYNDDNGKPVSSTMYGYAPAVDLGGLFSVSVKGDKKGSIVLAEKSSAPWQEKSTWKDDDGKTYTDTWWNYSEDKKGDPITNPSQLSISFTKATGIFTGKATVYFDYEVPSFKKNRDGEYDVTYTMQHKTASVPYAGVMIVEGSSLSGYGAAIYTFKHTEEDCTTGRAKSVTDKVSLPVILE